MTFCDFIQLCISNFESKHIIVKFCENFNTWIFGPITRKIDYSKLKLFFNVRHLEIVKNGFIRLSPVQKKITKSTWDTKVEQLQQISQKKFNFCLIFYSLQKYWNFFINSVGISNQVTEGTENLCNVSSIQTQKISLHNTNLHTKRPEEHLHWRSCINSFKKFNHSVHAKLKIKTINNHLI